MRDRSDRISAPAFVSALGLLLAGSALNVMAQAPLGRPGVPPTASSPATHAYPQYHPTQRSAQTADPRQMRQVPQQPVMPVSAGMQSAPPGGAPVAVPPGAGTSQPGPAGTGSHLGMPVPFAALPAPPSRAMALVGKRVEQQIEYGFDLANRGALFAAQAQFIQALHVIAQSLDASTGSTQHSDAVVAGLKAFEEADDFLLDGPNVDQKPNMSALIAAHRTPVLKKADSDRIVPWAAFQAYYAYAQKQLIFGAGQQPAASLALYGLGRVQLAAASEGSVKKMAGGPKAMALHQAALLVDAQNYRAANELGVLLARYGELDRAEEAFMHCLAIHPHPTCWENLALIYEKQGRVEDARNARAQHQKLQEATRAIATAGMQESAVRWVDPVEFAQHSSVTDGGNPPGVFAQAATADASHATAAGKTPTPSNSWAGKSFFKQLQSRFRSE